MKRAVLLCFLVCINAKSVIIDSSDCHLPVSLTNEIASYQTFVDEIIKEATVGKYAGYFYQDLAAFVDKFGNRIAGSNNLEESIKFLQTSLTKENLKVHLDPVEIPYWVRGEESAYLLSPRKKKLNILGLGFSPSTGPSGVTADVMVVSDFEELEKNSEKVKGKIILFNNVFTSYSPTVKYRTRGPAKASKLGAVAVLVRSITPFSLYSPHTGTTHFGPGDKPIPAAAITLEDADSIDRMYRAGHKVIVTLKMSNELRPNKTSHNLIADMPGLIPHEYAIVSGHIDSWDVGWGALDDGVGAFLALHSLHLLNFINASPPKRTLRAILWTAEELGLYGANHYAAKYKDEMKNWTIAMESDGGLYKPLGLTFNGTDESYCIMKEIVKLFKNLNATEVKRSPWVGSDISDFNLLGIPLAEPYNVQNNYFWYHHTDADSMNALNSTYMDQNLAIFAGTSYILANLSISLPRPGQSVWDFF